MTNILVLLFHYKKFEVKMKKKKQTQKLNEQVVKTKTTTPKS